MCNEVKDVEEDGGNVTGSGWKLVMFDSCDGALVSQPKLKTTHRDALSQLRKGHRAAEAIWRMSGESTESQQRSAAITTYALNRGFALHDALSLCKQQLSNQRGGYVS